jgi:hypothetical protein
LSVTALVPVSCQSSVNAIAPRDTRDLLPDAPVEHHGTTLSIMA